MEHLLNIGKSSGSGSSVGGASGGLPGSAAAFTGQLDPAMKQQADNLWHMLDELAASDPKAYEQFIQNQAKTAADAAAAEAASKPREEAAVVMVRSGTQTVAVHMWPGTSQEVPMARVKSGPATATTADWTGLEIPLARVTPSEDWKPTPGLQDARHLHCSVNQASLKLAGAHTLFRLLLHEAICQWAETSIGTQLDRSTRSMQVASRYHAPQQIQPPTPTVVTTQAQPEEPSTTTLQDLLPSTKPAKVPLIQVLK